METRYEWGTTTNGIDLGQAHGEGTHLGAP